MRARWMMAALAISISGTVLVSVGIGAAGLEEGIPCTLENGLLELQQTEQQLCAQIEVTKTVEGTASQGTTFEVVVDCGEPRPRTFGGRSSTFQGDPPQGQFPPFTETLVFGRKGGTQSVYSGSAADCTISEDDVPEGCTLISINPETVEVTDPVLYEVEVTNECEKVPPAAQPRTFQPDFTG